MAVKKSDIVQHLKGDIKTFKHEADEDRELISRLGKKMKKKKVSSKMKKAGKKAARVLKKDIKAGIKERKVSKVEREFKAGKLHSGSKKGPLVTNPKQAIAIALSEGRRAVRKKKKK